MAHIQQLHKKYIYGVKNARCIWGKQNPPNETEEERNPVWQTNGSFPPCESDFHEEEEDEEEEGMQQWLLWPTFPPFSSQFILLGTLEVYGIWAEFSYTLGRPPRDSKGMAALALTVHKEGTRAKRSSHSWFPSLHSPFTLALQLRCLPACLLAAWLSSEPADVSSWKRR